MTDTLKKIAAKVQVGMDKKVRTAGIVEFKRDQGPMRRNVRVQNHEWNPENLRSLSKILWACERSHSYAISALRLFSKMPASDFSPDGLLGGVGYIQSIKDMRTSLSQSVENISNFVDTLHDEINADHWSLALDDSEVESIMEDTVRVKENPEEFVENEYDKEVGDGPGDDEHSFANPSPDAMNPQVENSASPIDEDEEDGGWGSLYAPVASASNRRVKKQSHTELPNDDESVQKEGLTAPEMVENTTWKDPPSNYASAMSTVPSKMASRIAFISTLPGPRVDHIGPGEGGEFGFFNGPEDVPSDDPAGEGFYTTDYIYEGIDANPGGSSGYSHPTDGDVTVLKAAQKIAGYSWLPGSRNEKIMNYYDRKVTPEQTEWMRANDSPDNPAGLYPDQENSLSGVQYDRLI